MVRDEEILDLVRGDRLSSDLDASHMTSCVIDVRA
jgi:hypothetical protein